MSSGAASREVDSEDSSSPSEQTARTVKFSSVPSSKRGKALGTALEIEQTGTEDIPSCRSFTCLGLVGTFVIIMVILIMMENARHYIPPERMGYMKVNRTNNSSTTPTTPVAKFRFTDPRFVLPEHIR